MGSHSYGVKLDQDALHIAMPTEQVGGFCQCPCWVTTLPIMIELSITKGKSQSPFVQINSLNRRHRLGKVLPMRKLCQGVEGTQEWTNLVHGTLQQRS